MRVRYSYSILLLALGAFGVPHIMQAQEGEIIQEKSETSVVIVKDSIPNNGERSVEEIRGQSDVLPVGPMPQINFPKIPTPEPLLEKDSKKPSVESSEKSKAEESQSNLSFNFIYYLFYKFKLVDSTDG